MRATFALLLFGVVALASAGCGSGPRAAVVTRVESEDLDGALNAYDRFRESEGGDGALLARVAALLLEEEARSEDPERRAAAISQLAYAGTEGAPILHRLAALEGTPPARLDALRVLAGRRDTDARLALRGLADSEDPTILTAAMIGMDPEADRELLLGYFGNADPRIRSAAAGRLAGAAEDPAVRAALSEAARVDPDASVRSAAVRALGNAGPPAFDVIRERLGDPSSGVRMGAVSALLRADRERAVVALGSLLASPPSSAGIEAARVVVLTARTDEEAAAPGAVTARAFLRRALASPNSGFRSQAGIALASLPRRAFGEAREEILRELAEALIGESDSGVRLSLANALLRHEETAEGATAALVALLEGEGMPRVQAAVMLASRDNEAARGVLTAYLDPEAGHAPELRRTAVRALARDALRPDAARAALRDPDPLVRIYAAGGILAAAAATSR